MQHCYMLIAKSHLLHRAVGELLVGYNLEPLQIQADHELTDELGNLLGSGP